MKGVKSLVSTETAASCYFRSSVEPPFRKALLQITEKCNLFCAHCFVSAGDFGDTIPLDTILDPIIPRLLDCRVSRVTLTGGEPFVHPKIVEIVQALLDANIHVSICTNATLITDKQIEMLEHMGGVQLNVSLDGFSPNSHGKFRGNKESFWTTLQTIRELAKHRLLKGILVTPNNLAELDEYASLCEFAAQNGAEYVLMNPLSSLGRGVRSQRKLGSPRQSMENIRVITAAYADRLQLVHIRFPNQDLPLASCEAGHIFYIFVQGGVTVCPYLVFAAKTPMSQYDPKEFFVGNIVQDADIARKLDTYNFSERYPMGTNITCNSCSMGVRCGKGCPAAVIANGDRLGSVDKEVCPVVNLDIE